MSAFDSLIAPLIGHTYHERERQKVLYHFHRSCKKMNARQKENLCQGKTTIQQDKSTPHFCRHSAVLVFNEFFWWWFFWLEGYVCPSIDTYNWSWRHNDKKMRFDNDIFFKLWQFLAIFLIFTISKNFYNSFLSIVKF